MPSQNYTQFVDSPTEKTGWVPGLCQRNGCNACIVWGHGVEYDDAGNFLFDLNTDITRTAAETVIKMIQDRLAVINSAERDPVKAWYRQRAIEKLAEVVPYIQGSWSKALQTCEGQGELYDPVLRPRPAESALPSPADSTGHDSRPAVPSVQPRTAEPERKPLPQAPQRNQSSRGRR